MSDSVYYLLSVTHCKSVFQFIQMSSFVSFFSRRIYTFLRKKKKEMILYDFFNIKWLLVKELKEVYVLFNRFLMIYWFSEARFFLRFALSLRFFSPFFSCFSCFNINAYLYSKTPIIQLRCLSYHNTLKLNHTNKEFLYI